MIDRAVAIADRYAKRYPALMPQVEVWSARARAIGLWNESGRLDRAELSHLRDVWATDMAARLPSRSRNDVWRSFFAATSVKRADAEDALAALTRYSPLPPSTSVADDEADGRASLLGGRAAEAVLPLRRAVTACVTPSNLWPRMRAAEELGEALEVTGDTAGACAAYAEVLARWGAATSTSVTARKARARARGIRCGGT